MMSKFRVPFVLGGEVGVGVGVVVVVVGFL